MKIIYRFEVRASMPVTTDENDVDLYYKDDAVSSGFRRQLEKQFFAVLKKNFDTECDGELMDFTIEDE